MFGWQVKTALILVPMLIYGVTVPVRTVPGDRTSGLGSLDAARCSCRRCGRCSCSGRSACC